MSKIEVDFGHSSCVSKINANFGHACPKLMLILDTKPFWPRTHFGHAHSNFGHAPINFGHAICNFGHAACNFGHARFWPLRAGVEARG